MLVVLGACGESSERRTAPAGETPGAPGSTAATPHLDPAWVTIADPASMQPGYTLTLHAGRVPVLLDLNGRAVHAWPTARVKSRVRLLPDGSLLGIGLGRQVVAYDWEGRQTWEHRTPGAIPHHDVIRLRNGNTLLVLLLDGEGADTLVEVSPAGEEVWRWRALDHLDTLLDGRRPQHPNDVTHVNSVQELPENPWSAAGDERFRIGNLLVSARNLDTIFVIERATGAVVWRYRGTLDRQHEALMNGPGLPGPGLVQLFDNRRASFATDRQSELVELDPRSGEVVWRWRTPGFFSPTGGCQQALPNGNLLVTSTLGHRVFEVGRDGRVVWEWAPPFEPGRALRVAPDATPQLAALTPPPVHAVVPPAGYRHVDRDAYRFARAGARRAVRVNDARRSVLGRQNDCRELLLPLGASVRLAYGVDAGRLAAAGRAGRPPRFVASLEEVATGRRRLLVDDAVGADGEPWREREVDLGAHALAVVRLCLAIDGGVEESVALERRVAYWEQPFVSAARDRAAGDLEGDGGDDSPTVDPPPGDLTPEELEVRRRHLRALGYVD